MSHTKGESSFLSVCQSLELQDCAGAAPPHFSEAGLDGREYGNVFKRRCVNDGNNCIVFVSVSVCECECERQREQGEGNESTC